MAVATASLAPARSAAARFFEFRLCEVKMSDLSLREGRARPDDAFGAVDVEAEVEVETEAEIREERAFVKERVFEEEIDFVGLLLGVGLRGIP